MKMPDKTFALFAHSNGKRESVLVNVWYGDAIELEVVTASRRYSASSANGCQNALKAIRREMEADGLLIVCAGSCINAVQSGMAADMGDGEMVYLVEMYVHATRGQLKNMWTQDAAMIPATVDQQAEFERMWLESPKKERPV